MKVNIRPGRRSMRMLLIARYIAKMKVKCILRMPQQGLHIKCVWSGSGVFQQLTLPPKVGRSGSTGSTISSGLKPLIVGPADSVQNTQERSTPTCRGSRTFSMKEVTLGWLNTSDLK